jgi:hypothetical protein
MQASQLYYFSDFFLIKKNPDFAAFDKKNLIFS